MLCVLFVEEVLTYAVPWRLSGGCCGQQWAVMVEQKDQGLSGPQIAGLCLRNVLLSASQWRFGSPELIFVLLSSTYLNNLNVFLCFQACVQCLNL